MDDSRQTTYDGEPPLPVLTKKVLIPYGKSVEDVELKLKDKKLVGRGIELQKTNVKVLSKEMKKNDVFPLDKYPIKNIRYMENHIRGYTVLTLNIVPVRYHPSNGAVWSYGQGDVQIALEEDESVNELYRGLPKDIEFIEGMVENPGMITSTYPKTRARANVDYLMITTSALQSEFQTLIDHKENRQIDTAVELVSDIEAEYSGNDTQEKIRNCIIDYYQNNGTEYVCLAGDTTDESGNDIVPHRGLYADCSSAGGCADEVPSDYYYCGLDSSWDEDGDGTYGEWADNPDWGMEVWAGRLPAQDATEASTLVNKVITWENGTCTYQHYSCCQDDSGNIGDMKRNKVDNTSYSDAVHSILSANFSINTDFESEEGSISASQYNQGISGDSSGGTPPMFVNHGGHGSPEYYNIGGNYYSETDANSLTNDWYPITASIACTSGTFDGRDNCGGSYTSDRDCIAEAFLKNPDGGMAATFMNTRYGLGTTDGGTGLSGAIDTKLYQGIFTQDFNNLGHAAQWARMDYIQAQGQDENARWSTQAMNLLGDPEMPVINTPEPTQENYSLDVNSQNGGWHFISSRLIEDGDTVTDILDDPTNGVAGNYDKVMMYNNPLELVTKGTVWSDDFEDGNVSPWTITSGSGVAFASTNTSNSGSYAIQMGEDAVTVDSPTIDLSGYDTVDLSLWIRRGDDSFSENPDTGEDLVVEYYDDSGTWNTLGSFAGGGTAGEIYTPNYELPINAMHAGFQVRVHQTGGSGSGYDYWHFDDVTVKYKAYELDQDALKWKTYEVGRADHYNTLDTLSPKIGFWVHMTNSDTLTIIGYEPDSTVLELKPGWNMVGYPSNTTGNNGLPAEVDKIGYYESSDPYNGAYDFNPGSFNFEPGQGYWIHNPTGGTIEWTVTN